MWDSASPLDCYKLKFTLLTLFNVFVGVGGHTGPIFISFFLVVGGEGGSAPYGWYAKQ